MDENRPGVWITTRGDGKWEVRHVGGRGVIGTYERRGDAIKEAGEYARQYGAKLFVQDFTGGYIELKLGELD